MKKFNGTEALDIVTQLTAKAEAAGNQLYLDTTEPLMCMPIMIVSFKWLSILFKMRSTY